MTGNNDDRDVGVWFETKRYGYGAGLPIAWQGWALVLGYLVLTVSAALALAQRHPVALAFVALALTAGFLPICARHTRGGWRWRWGSDD